MVTQNVGFSLAIEPPPLLQFCPQPKVASKEGVFKADSRVGDGESNFSFTPPTLNP